MSNRSSQPALGYSENVMTTPFEPSPAPVAEASPARLFPRLSSAQIARIAAHGRRRPTSRGELLVDVGDAAVPLFVVVSGEVQVLRVQDEREALVVNYHAGHFSGEASTIAGRRALVRLRVTEPGEVIEVDRERFLRLVQIDAELSEILMRTLLLRRVELVAHGFGDVVVVGSTHCAATLRVKEFLTRNGHPYRYIDLDADPDSQQLLDRFHIGEDDVPVLICRGTTVLRNPSNREIASCLGFNDAIRQAETRDLLIIGAGPAGLAAAVYGASEGLDVLVLESNAPGGQAGSSSRIENYLGFPTGISGLDLAGRAHAQAEKFGANIAIAKAASRLLCRERPFSVRVDEDTDIATRAVIIATGAEYRKPAIARLSDFEGTGVYYGATAMEAQLCVGEEVIVIGGGNSAGQAAVFLAEKAAHVHLLVRGASLADSMSRYLIRRIEGNPRITLRLRTALTGLDGNGHLERVSWQEGESTPEPRNLRHVFMMTGAIPNTGWLHGCLILDDKGFIKTGSDLSKEELATAGWPLGRSPYLLETSRPGIFAVGDVRSGSMKRVASAVGEGSTAIALVHQALRE
jgi:thioredoxin reductase (NADPH)